MPWPKPRRTMPKHIPFDDLVAKGEPDECWIWQGTIDRSTGYGRYGKRRAHIVALERETPRPTDKTHALHATHCTSRLCVNPAHLRWGTQAENMQDLAKVGNRKGSKAAMAKLTEQQVLEIRSLAGKYPQTEIGAMFGVSGPTVNNILKRKTWAHI